MSDAPTADPTLDAQPALPAPEGRPPWPRWLVRTITAVVILAFLAFGWWGFTSGGSDADNSAIKGAVIALSPPEGAQAPRQQAVGADLEVGYDGRLVINGIEIPEEQMEGARDPEKVDPADLAANGVRPNNRNFVYFRPGPGKVIEEFEQGPVTVQLRYFKEARENTTSNTVTWSFRVD